MRWMVGILILLLALPMALACTTPVENLNINETMTLCAGTYQLNDTDANGALIINASDIVISCNGTILSGNFSESGFSGSNKNNVTLRDCVVLNYRFAVNISSIGNLTITNNTFNFTEYGISGFNNNKFNITNNTFSSNDTILALGMHIIGSENSHIEQNIFSQLNSGVFLQNAPYLLFTNNYVDVNGTGLYAMNSSHTTAENNRIHGYGPLIHLFSLTNATVVNNTLNVTGYATGLTLSSVNNSHIFNNTIYVDGSYSGLVLTDSSNNNHLHHNYLIGANIGQLWLTERSNNNIVEYNSIESGTQYLLTGNASNNIIRHNTINNSWGRNFGISDLRTTNNTYYNNTATNCIGSAHALWSKRQASGNSFYNFTAINCTNGMYFSEGSSNNAIIDATLLNMTNAIIVQDQTRNNTFENIRGNGIEGIVFTNTNASSIRDMSLTATQTGITLTNSENIALTKLAIDGILTGAIITTSNDITFTDINITGASGPDTGIRVNDTRNLTITNSNISANTGSGIRAYNSTFHVSDSTINSNTGYGIVNYDLPILETASTILSNTICHNTLLPIFSLDAAITTISGNEFCGAAIAYEQNWSIQIRARRDGIMLNETNITIWQPYTNSTSYNISITNNTGVTPTIIITEYLLDASETRTNLTPHRLLAEKESNEIEINMTIHETRTTAIGDAINLTLPGVVPPYFTGIPDNDTVIYAIDWDGVDFNATDSGTFDSYAVNDTLHFTINASGYLDNATALVAGTYVLNITINDTEGYINSTLYELTVSRATSNVSTYLNNSRANITIEQGASILLNSTRTAGEGNISLYNNGTLINTGTSLSNLTQFITLGLYNITTVYAQTENYTASTETYWVNVTTDNTAPTITLISPSNGASATTSAYNFTFNIGDTNNITNCSLIIDGSVSSTLENPEKTLAGIYASGLSVASHTWSINCADYYNNTANSSTYAFTVTSDEGSGGGGGGGGGGGDIYIYPVTNTTDDTDNNETEEDVVTDEPEEENDEDDSDNENIFIDPQENGNDRDNKFIDGGNGEPYKEEPRLKPYWELDWNILWLLPAFALPFIPLFARRRDPYKLLKRYIEAHVLYGTKPGAIKTELLNTGWSEDAIRKYLFLQTADDRLYPLRQYIHDHETDEALATRLQQAHWDQETITKAHEQREHGHEMAQMFH